MRDENGEQSNRGNRMFDLLDMLAEQGRIARDPNWRPQPPAPPPNGGVDDPYRMARYEAGAARNTQANLDAKDRVEQAGLDPTTTTIIASAVDAVGGVNNRQDAQAIVDRTIQAVRDTGDTRAEAIASSELMPLLENFRHATPEAAATNSARQSSTPQPQQQQQAQAQRTPDAVERQRQQREEQRAKQAAAGNPLNKPVQPADVPATGTEDASTKRARQQRNATRRIRAVTPGAGPDGSVWDVTRGSGDVGRRDVVASYRIKPTPADEWSSEQVSTPAVQELSADGATRFYTAIAAAKNADPTAAAVALYDVEDYAKMRLFLTEDGTAGFAIKPGDVPDIVSVFNTKGGPNKGVSYPLMRLAVEQGGRKLDAFDTVLPTMYSANGFEVVARQPWNDEYAPEGWDYERFNRFNGGRPDVVFMAFTDTMQDYKPGDGKYVEDWSEGEVLQAQAVEEAGTKPTTETKFTQQPVQQWQADGSGASPQVPGSVPGELRIRVPTSKKKGAVVTNPEDDLRVDLATLLTTPVLADKLANIVRAYPQMSEEDAQGTTEQVLDRFVERVKENYLVLYDALPDEFRQRAKKWYDGANRIAKEWALEFGLKPEAVAGILAVMSPQKDWFQNVSLARRILDIAANPGQAKWNPAMNGRAVLTKVFAKPEPKKKKLKSPPKIGLDGKLIKQKKPPKQIDKNKLQEWNERIAGKDFKDLKTYEDKARWLRVYDEALLSRSFPVVTPEGDILHSRTVKTGKGKDSKVAWQSFKNIAKAIMLIEDPTIENIDKAIGNEHKVRSFYNNIHAPNSPRGPATSDTHNVAAGLLLPLGGNSREVEMNFGVGPSDASTGATGTYGLYTEGLRRARAERDVDHPRQMQSITWEGVRILFEASKKQSEIKDMRAKWQAVREGRMTREELHAEIADRIRNAGLPEWYKLGAITLGKGEYDKR